MTSVSKHNSKQEGEGGDGVNGGVHLSSQIQIIIRYKRIFERFQDEIRCCDDILKIRCCDDILKYVVVMIY